MFKQHAYLKHSRKRLNAALMLVHRLIRLRVIAIVFYQIFRQLYGSPIPQKERERER